jgi:ribonuclease HI
LWFYEALHWIEAVRTNHVIIETDAEGIVKAIEKKKFPRTSWGTIANRISRDLVNLDHVKIEAVRTNHVTRKIKKYFKNLVGRK